MALVLRVPAAHANEGLPPGAVGRTPQGLRFATCTFVLFLAARQVLTRQWRDLHHHPRPKCRDHEGH
jgi:hypothetical protein